MKHVHQLKLAGIDRALNEIKRFSKRFTKRKEANMSFIKVYIHFVWSTKDWIPYLDSPELRKEVWKHISQNAKEKKHLH